MACERFVYTENLASQNGQTFDGKGASPPAVGGVAPPSAREDIPGDGTALLTKAVQQAAAKFVEDDGWVNLGQVKIFLTQLRPDFDVRVNSKP